MTKIEQSELELTNKQKTKQTKKQTKNVSAYWAKYTFHILHLSLSGLLHLHLHLHSVILLGLNSLVMRFFLFIILLWLIINSLQQQTNLKLTSFITKSTSKIFIYGKSFFFGFFD